MSVTIRANDVKTSNLLLVGLILGTVAQVLQFIPAFSSHFFGTLVFVVFSLLPGVAFVWLIRQGYLWAKAFFLLLVVVGVPLYLPRLSGQNIPMSTFLYLACALPELWAVFIILKDLLRKPDSADVGAAQG